MANTNSKPRVLPADVYDTLELSALEYGGIGAGKFRERPTDGVWLPPSPCCVWGHAGELSDHQEYREISKALNDAEIGFAENDAAVNRVNRRKGKRDRDAKITFEEWATELNVVRGA